MPLLSIVENNPFRVLGAYSDSKLMDIIANANKIKAFAKVGRSVPFEIDAISGFSAAPERTIGGGLGWLARRIFARGGIRKFIREESDHPLVKRFKKEGFS